MKKQFLLLSAFSLAASAAHAQSSVTLFGVVDATVAYGTGSLSDKTQLTNGGYSSNRIGFRGEEDLGGGLRANFWLEAGLNVDNGTGSATNTNNQASGAASALAGGQGLAFGRRSTVGLSGPWGEVRAGRDYTPQYWNLFYGDPFGNVGVGTSVNLTNAITGATLVRASNALEYLTPTVGGFSAIVMHYFGENASGTATSSDGTGDGLQVVYANGPFSGRISYGRTDYASGEVLQRNIQAEWKFGNVLVMGDVNRDVAGTLNSKGVSLGATWFVGNDRYKVAYSTHQTDMAGEPEAAKLALGFVHNLSKRTAVYATYARLNNSGGSAVGLNGATTAANDSANGFDLGISHSF